MEIPLLFDVTVTLGGASEAGISTAMGWPSAQIVTRSSLKPYLFRSGFSTSLKVFPLWATTLITRRDGKSILITFVGTTSTSWLANTELGYLRLIIWNRNNSKISAQ